jgi:hypothetical protein
MIENARYSEESYLYGRILNYTPVVIIVACIILAQIRGSFIAFAREAFPVLIVAVILIFMPLLMGRMIVAITGDELVVVWGYLGWIKKVFKLNDIVSTEVVTYHPIRQFGGWGIRYGKFRGELTGCHTASGDKGLLITFSCNQPGICRKTNKYIIGSKTPEDLKSAIEKS